MLRTLMNHVASVVVNPEVESCSWEGKDYVGL